MPFFRKRRIVKAVQFDGTADAVFALTGLSACGLPSGSSVLSKDGKLLIGQNSVVLEVGDWLVKNDIVDFEVYTSTDFNETFESNVSSDGTLVHHEYLKILGKLSEEERAKLFFFIDDDIMENK